MESHEVYYDASPAPSGQSSYVAHLKERDKGGGMEHNTLDTAAQLVAKDNQHDTAMECCYGEQYLQ